jgi:hypothetical protein
VVATVINYNVEISNGAAKDRYRRNAETLKQQNTVEFQLTMANQLRRRALITQVSSSTTTNFVIIRLAAG